MLPKAMKQAMKFRAWTHLVIAILVAALTIALILEDGVSWELIAVLVAFAVSNVYLHFRYIDAIKIIDEGSE